MGIFIVVICQLDSLFLIFPHTYISPTLLPPLLLLISFKFINLHTYIQFPCLSLDFLDAAILFCHLSNNGNTFIRLEEKSIAPP